MKLKKRCFRNQVLAAAAKPACVLEFEPGFERRNCFVDKAHAK